MTSLSRDRPASTQGPPDLGIANIVMCEGADDQALLRAVVDELGLGDFLLHDMGGKDTNWALRLQTMAEDGLFKSRNHSVSLVVDADTDPIAAFDSCANALVSIGFPRPSGHGAVVQSGSRKAGVFVMPDGTTLGALEGLLLALSEPSRLALAEDYIDSVISAGLPSPRLNSKGIIQAYMASFPESPRTPSIGIKLGAFDLHSRVLDDLRQFVGALAL